MSHRVRFSANGRNFNQPDASFHPRPGDTVKIPGGTAGKPTTTTLIITGPAAHTWVGASCTSMYPAQVVETG